MEVAKVYFYRPPSVLIDVVKKTRKAKHIDHYVGPAVIVKNIGSRSFQISYTNPLTGTTQLLQRDAGMIILKKEWLVPSLAPSENRLIPRKHQEGMELQVGDIWKLYCTPKVLWEHLKKKCNSNATQMCSQCTFKVLFKVH